MIMDLSFGRVEIGESSEQTIEREIFPIHKINDDLKIKEY